MTGIAEEYASIHEAFDAGVQRGRTEAIQEMKEYDLPLCENDQEFIRELLDDENGFFGAVFKRRTDGGIRVMNCRLNVQCHSTGGVLGYDPKKKNLIPVWDRWAGYRMIPIENVISLRVGGMSYLFA